MHAGSTGWVVICVRRNMVAVGGPVAGLTLFIFFNTFIFRKDKSVTLFITLFLI